MSGFAPDIIFRRMQFFAKSFVQHIEQILGLKFSDTVGADHFVPIPAAGVSFPKLSQRDFRSITTSEQRFHELLTHIRKHTVPLATVRLKCSQQVNIGFDPMPDIEAGARHDPI